MQQSEAGGRNSWWRTTLETMATVAFIVTCGVLVWSMLLQRPRQSIQSNPAAAAAARQTRPPAPEPAPPAGPVSLDGASVQGSRSAKAALIVYSDFQCPYCGKFERDTLPGIQARYIRSGQVLLAFRHFPLSIHSFAEKAAEATECAGQQGKFWEMHDQLFQHQQQLEESNLVGYARTVGLKTDTFQTCLGGQFAGKVQQDAASGRAFAISGTPTFLIGRLQSDGRVKVTQRMTGALPLQQFQAALDRVLASDGTIASK